MILNQPSLDKFESVLEKNSVVVLNTSIVTNSVQRKDLNTGSIDATNIARDMGNARVANIVTLGAFIKKTKLLKRESIEKAIADLFSSKKPELVEINIKALRMGMEMCS